ncbi:MraY family glycosyltransferase, partial [Thiohalorhabdus sp.]|uniref:MraY family glycosyltransferase n=1 Tax=Thiohalorhabdus sp. TaxID=3094134 RepID=UPI002FC2D511
GLSMLALPLLFLAALLVCLFLMLLFRRPAVHLGLVDIPGGRKLHEGHVALVGGIGLFGGFTFVALLLERDLGDFRGLFWGMGVLLIAGILDDLRELRPRHKALAQLIAAGALVLWGGLTVGHLGEWSGLGRLELGWLAVPFTLLCVVGLINAVNMMDGADGLAGGVTLVMLLWLVATAALAGQAGWLALPMILAGAVLGFLGVNFPHPWRSCASVFLGDSGSMLLGFGIAWFAIGITYTDGTGVSPVAIAWILALPVFDTLSLMVRRLSKGRNPMAPDREHLHHVFQRAGFSLRGTVYILVGIAFAMGAIGVAGWQLGVPDWVMMLGLLAAFAGHLYFVQHAWRMVRVMRRMRGRRSGVGRA